MANRLTCILLLASLMFGDLAAQTKPAWTNIQKNSIGSGFYYGIGNSPVSSDEADTRAFIEFSRNVQVKVTSIIQREVSEQGKEFYERTNISTELISDVSLKGIAITERYTDTTTVPPMFFSLIQFRISEYDSMVQFQIEREIVLMKVRNRMEEEKRQEEIRAQKVQHQLEEDRTKEEIRSHGEKLNIEQQRRKQQELEKVLHQKIFGEFLSSAPPEKVISFRNGEISQHEHSLMVKGGIAPLEFNTLFYSVRSAMFELSANAIFQKGRWMQQETNLKIQILPRVGEFTRTSLALGALQAVGQIADSGFDIKRSRFSLFVAGNITVPGYYYSTFSFYADKRKLSIGMTSFPFYEQFKNHLGFLLEMNSIFDPEFRYVQGNSFVVNAGVRFQGSETFSTQFTVEEYEQLNLSFEFQF